MICHAKWQMQVQTLSAGTKCRTVGVLLAAPEGIGDGAPGMPRKVWATVPPGMPPDATKIEVRPETAAVR